MTAPRSLLLDLIGDARAVDSARVAAVAPEQWADLARIAAQHRIEPLLHWQIARRHGGTAIPDAVRAAWQAAYVGSSRRQPTIRFEIRALAGALADAGIPAIMLKGAFLAFHAYPDAALRPLRDIDVLVPDDRALDAYRLLREQGASTQGDDAAALAYALAVGEHHLPGLATRHGFALVELHRHIQSLATVAAADRDGQLIDDMRAHAQTLDLAGVAVAYPAPTDLLLHLVLHAASNHLLDNGPLAIADIAFLLRAHPIEWPRFWAGAARIGLARAAALLLDLAVRYWGPLPIGWRDGRVPPGLTAAGDLAVAIMLQDRDLSGDVWRERHAARGARGRVVTAWRSLFLPRVELAMIHGLPPRSPRVWAHYPARWWSLTRRALPRRRAGTVPEVRGQLDAHAALARWLLS